MALTTIFALTGQYPQQLGTDPQTGEVLWQSQVMGISADLKTIFAKVLQFDPRDRYSSAREMLKALQPDQLSPKSTPAKSVPIPSPIVSPMSNMQTVAVTPRGYTSPAIQNQSAQNQPPYVYQSPQEPKKRCWGSYWQR